MHDNASKFEQAKAALSPAEWVVLIVSRGYRAHHCYPAAEQGTRTTYGGAWDGISGDEFNAAKDKLNRQGYFMRQGVLTMSGERAVESFHPERGSCDAKLRVFAGVFSAREAAQ